MFNETETQTRLRRAKESLESARDAENEMRKALADAVANTRRTKERYENLFLREEAEEVTRRRDGYLHETK